jgi:hypothetical protein
MYLTTFQIQEGDQHRLRSVLSLAPVSQEDAVFYYHILLGFQSLNIQVHTREVPDSFTLSLLGAKSSDVPEHFPAHDLETDEGGVANYFTLMDRVCEMERMRVEYGIGAGTTVAAATPQTDSTPLTTTSKFSENPTQFKSLVEEVMRTLETTAQTHPYNSLDQDQTFAWMLTPILKEVRETRGSRVITSEDVGKAWAHRLGTEVFPDIVVSRRFTTADWKFQHPSSDALARQAIYWYLEAQMLGEPAFPGVSPWILQADEELAAVLTPFKNVGPMSTFGTVPMPSKTKKDKVHPTTAVLQRLEGDHILSALTNEKIVQLTADTWERYLRHVFRAFSIGTSVVENCWGPVQDTIQIWIRGNMGVRTDREALVAAWKSWWDVLVVPQPTPERFELFLCTLDLHDPILSINISNTRKYDIAAGWIKAFIETEMVADTSFRIPAAQYYDRVRSWCQQYVALPTMENTFKPVNVGPVTQSLGYLCQKTKKGRAILGLRPKHMETEPVSEEESPDVLSYFAAPQKTDGLSVLAKSEIHLGSV